MKRKTSKGLALLTASAVAAVTVLGTGTSAAQAAEAEYEIYPKPHEISYEGDSWILKNEVNVVYEDGIDEATQDRLDEVFALKDGITVSESDEIVEGKTNVLVGIDGSDGYVDQYAEENVEVSADGLFDKLDSYVLDSKEDVITVLGADTDASFYGLTTLYHIVKQMDSQTIRSFHIEDWADVARVCEVIGIPYYSVDFSEEYMDRVFRLFVEEYRKGRTPNPDVLCNREVKFGPFVKFARGLGADYIATGHYCDIAHDGGRNYLLRAADENKDQTYFLNQVTERQLDDVIFPLGAFNKYDVREYARAHEIPVAGKKDSTGICFIGERKFREFLSRYIPMKEGDIVTADGRTVGRHRGVYYYTIGQRRGLGIGGSAEGNGESWFVLDKDVEHNRLIVSQGEDDVLFKDALMTEGFNFITRPEGDDFECEVRIRHRQPLQRAHAYILKDGVRIEFAEKQRAIAPGQYAVCYRGRVCLGGGVIGAASDRGEDRPQ